MASGPVLGLVPMGSGITIAGMPAVTPPNRVRIANASPSLFKLAQYNPSNNGTTPSPLSGHMFPIQPLPGGAGQAGPVGYPIDSG